MHTSLLINQDLDIAIFQLKDGEPKNLVQKMKCLEIPIPARKCPRADAKLYSHSSYNPGMARAQWQYDPIRRHHSDD